ncbi:hypothetical protein H310_01273 [Aphanomyces invadans]|uniref:VPS9 domain-containing protein n=1 Tax=Aphanomyces invadans TaxID=157072 RepID=A0A024URE1_9STRA|nr:hypothetical protein H310_01273 [Aphanomyces invadans]ETW08755.1 hypothetical protein H310_01273 [Aphanomyces invadans]|eukprot:XP_008862560.1 hypothetical protein H310_01273 [Aphanomyces invadans]
MCGGRTTSPRCMPNVLGNGTFRRVLLNLDGTTLHHIVAHVCQAWRFAAMADDIWTSLLLRDFPSSILQPLPHAKWIYVYLAEQSRRSVLSTPVQVLPCGARLHVTLDGQGFHILLGASGPIELFGRARSRKSSRDAWKTIDLSLSSTHVAIVPSSAHSNFATTQASFHLPTTDIKQTKAHLHFETTTVANGSRRPPTIVVFDSEEVASAWCAAILHNIRDFQSKYRKIVAPSSSTTASPRSGRKFALPRDSRHHLRKFHAFRLTQAIQAVSKPCERRSISSSVLNALHGKPHGSHDADSYNDHHLDPAWIAHLTSPRCAGGCGSAVDGNLWTCCPKCERHAALVATRSGDTLLRRERAAFHLVPQPSIVVMALLHNPDTFEGHAIGQFVGRFKKVTTALSSQAAHGNLCATRDVIANLTQYMVAFRQPELASCGVSADEIAAAVYLAIERTVCLQMQTWLEAWVQISVADRDQDMLCKMLAAWAKVPPTAAQFGLANDFVLVKWDAAVQSLRDMDNEVLPSGKLRHLLHAAKEIFDLHAHSGLGDAATRALSADDFLPVFIFCVCQASLRTPLATIEYLWCLCNDESLKGEAGYYLTMLEASLEYVRTYEPRLA